MIVVELELARDEDRFCRQVVVVVVSNDCARIGKPGARMALSNLVFKTSLFLVGSM